ncbi:hypothetical protein L2747_12320 [Shewanella marinintestina]|uniref:hypothetical protein n=1 Tax=Shewanella marinintestina TaxID=190305 RepID=UPI00200E6F57|nr:hypothetical protein [Shewanella marinintestina]MCL1146784.1 hypothetical protein [Shewanella marinintestina]
MKKRLDKDCKGMRPSSSHVVFTFISSLLFAVSPLSFADDSSKDSAKNSLPKSSANKQLQQLVIFGQTFNFNLPVDWKLAYSEQQETMYSAEFVPMGQELQTWSSMVCVQGFKGVAEDIEPQEFLETMANVYLESCQGEMVFEDLPSEPLGGHETASAIIGCTQMPNTHIKSIKGVAYSSATSLGEIGHYTVVKGKADLYLIHKSIRGNTFNKANPPVKAHNYQEFLSSIMPLSLH